MTDEGPPKVRLDGSALPIEAQTTGHRVTLTCTHGHVWHEEISAGAMPSCPHGRDVDTGAAQQVDLVCPACGRGYSITGDVGRRTCAACGAPMVCPQCLAGRTEEEPRAVGCPICEEPPLAVMAAPAVIFAGAVTKRVASDGIQ